MTYNRTLAQVIEESYRSKLRRVAPGDEVGARRARKQAEAQAPVLHEMLLAVSEAGGWIGQRRRSDPRQE